MYICIDFLRTSAKPCPASDRLLVSHQSFSVSFTLSDLILEHTRTVTWFWMVLILSILAVGACAVSMFPKKVEQLCFSLFFFKSYDAILCLAATPCASRNFQDKACDPMALASMLFPGNFLRHRATIRND